MTVTRAEEKAARNEVLFREANERISRKGQEVGFVGKVPFLCECEEPGCTEILRLEAAEYERARAGARRFVLVPGHDTRGAEVIESNENFMIVEKGGLSGEIAEETDPRRIG